MSVQDYLLILLFGSWILAVFSFKWFRSRKTDTRILGNGHTYAYVIGDDLRLYGHGATFYGLGVVLPKQFPQLYLDSRRGGGRGARYVIDASQRISLEGDFDAYFQLYAPKGSEQLALSIISPDVMQTLMGVAGAYDIELYRNQLHIISHKPVRHHAKRQSELLKIMDSVLGELDQRMRSWPSAYMPGEKDRLELYPLRGIRIFGYYVPVAIVLFDFLWVFIVGVLFFMSLATEPSWKDHALFLIPAILFTPAVVWVNTTKLRTSKFRPAD